MNSWKLIVLQLLIIGLMTPVFSKPADKSKDYQNDDYNDDESEQKDSSSNDVTRSNSVPPAYFREKDYTKMYQLEKSITLKCEIGNYDTKRNDILWYKNDMKHTLFVGAQSFDVDHRYSLTEDHSLIISHPKESDAGVYLCNVLPENITLSIKLQPLVALAANVFVNDRDATDRAITFKQGDQFEIACRAGGTHSSNIKYSWSSDGNAITSDEDITVDGGKLIIKKANKNHVRLYQCLADDGSNTAHATVRINIQYVPNVSVHRSIINTQEKHLAHLDCEYETTSESEVTWLDINGEPINQANPSKYKILRDVANKNLFKSTLAISNVNQHDLGKYVCKVQNALGARDVNVELTYKPEPPRLNATEQEGESVITHWHIRSLQPLTEVQLNYRKKGEIDWKGDSPIDHEQSKFHSGAWRIKHKMALAPGHWHVRVQAKNEFGWSEYSTDQDLIVQEYQHSSAMALTSSCAFGLSFILSIYSINFSTRLFG